MTIFEYLSYREWLEVWFVEKKATNPNYSHRMIARLCHQKSPSFFRDVTTGRRNLTVEQQKLLLKLLNLTDEESDYFRDLVTFDQDSSVEKRAQAFERISSARRLHASKRVEGDEYLYLSNWYYPAIRELALCHDFQLDPKWISRKLCHHITPEQVSAALEIIFRLGFLEKDEHGQIVVKDISITTPNQVFGLAVHQYHQQMLDMAKNAVDQVQAEHRHLLGVTVSIPFSKIELVKEELNQMASRLLDMCDSMSEDKDVTVQLGLQMFPLSEIQSR